MYLAINMQLYKLFCLKAVVKLKINKYPSAFTTIINPISNQDLPAVPVQSPLNSTALEVLKSFCLSVVKS